ncbi:mono-functional DNA-alkylating methyl methanesulfonate N-term domain-containing protein [Hirsutella rhossiliensis]|uniref:Mono-functional DNA-alkylating methyl methanesulfonate n-term domain-containing protein n=1 Tax=Hirsutella rhossiliensis TaxID=111463 RepID=A0A9P8N6A2_9HYPO|nr:mono-functional DNA-alkylating methyl methanesulfonate n-term domain-containing protein [Hirsutella rhossiliensis]KAH0966569.1 mono-functional DNA-alkylating methyl methanesulfonate n-term domain-containing protein [Hirsutella rhossiliensis]
MAYVAPVHKPTSIRHALRIRFLSPHHEDLVLAKANRLEIWRLTDDGITCLHTKLIYGTISMLQRLQPKDLDIDLLFIGTDRLQYFNVAWNPETNQLDTVEQTIEDTAEQYMRHSQSQNKCLVDPTGKFMAMHLWEGVLNVFRLPTRKGVTTKLVALDQVRLTELWMKASTFLHSRTGHPRIAFLYKTQLDHEEARIAVYRLTKDDRGNDVSKFDPHKERELDHVIPDPYASMLIPVPIVEEKRYHVRNNEGTRAHLGGVLVVGETLLTYFDSLTYSSVSSALQEPKIYVAYADYNGIHYFLADDYGRMDILTIQTTVESTGVVVTGMAVSPMKYQDSPILTSRASSLVYMGNNTLFLASHHGDSQLFRVDVESETMFLVKTLSNNAPILDFAIMDMGNREGDSQLGNAFSSGQARIVAGCGAYRDGSLRSIRSGVGLDDQGILDEIQGTRGLFTLRSYGAEEVDTIVLSFIAETRVLRFDRHGGIEEVYAFQGLELDRETLLATDLSNGQVLQITPQSVTLLDSEAGIAVSTWQAPQSKTITAASANSKWALLAVDGSTLVSLNLFGDLAATTKEAALDPTTGLSDQISCLHAAREPQDFGVVGWWSSGTISVVDLASLKPIHGESLRETEDSASVPRDIVLIQLHPPSVAGPTLLVAMEDGNVVTFNVSVKGFAISGRKSVILGSSPARLHVLPQDDGTCNVFATTEHASLIYSAEGRIIYSATTADDATYVAPFDSAAFPDSIVLSTDGHVRLCHIDKERLTHVKALPVQETVRRVAYSPGLKAFGLGCIKKELVQNEEIITSAFKLVDEIIFQELGKPLVLNASTSLEMVECVIRAELPDSSGALAERFIVGTSFIADDDAVEDGDTRGRILVLGVGEDRQVYQIVSHDLKGACRCLGVIGERIVAGLSKTVVVYSYSEDTTVSGSLQKVAAYRLASFPVDLDVSGNMIGVVDLMQSLSLVEFIPPLDGARAKLEERARHYQPAWATSVCHLDENRWLEADAQGNIVVLRRNMEAPTEQDRSRLEVTSEMNIGEQINRMRRLHVASTENAVVYPKAFLGSVDGTLYLFGDISPQYQDLLMTFQARLQEYIYAPGNIHFDVWRAFRNQAREGDGPYRFVDGEMVERFLDLDEAKQELVCEGLGPSVEDMRNMIEELRRMH